MATPGIYRRIGGAWVLLGAGQVAPDTTPPSVPPNLRQTASTQTSVTVACDASTDDDTGVARYEWQIGASSSPWASSGLARVWTFTGLDPVSAYTVSVRAVDKAGNTSGVRQITAATGTALPPPSSVLMGVSNSNETHGGFTHWDVMRVYTFGAVADAVAVGAKVVALTDEKGCPMAGGQQSADILDRQLTTIFGKWPTLEVHWANGNEVDADAPNMTQYKATMAAMRAVVDKHKALGRKVSLWIDLTASHVRNADGSTNFEVAWRDAAAQYIDGIAGSFYPPGRLKTPVVFTDYPTYLDPFFDVALNWGVRRLSCWETGIPIDTGDKQHRPRYINGFIRYLISKAATTGVDLSVLCYWDKQKTGGPDNRFAADPAGTNPTTAAAWHDWQNYYG